MDKHVYSVSELTREIKLVLEESFPIIWIEAEISNFKRHSSGHLYFSLKDQNSQLSCAMWRFKANSLSFRPENGQKVMVSGEIQVYERGGYYQLIVQEIHPAGIGDLQLAFERLKQKLNAEGLFDAFHKKSLPLFPQKIGIITSPTGAAIRDMISVTQRRYPAAELILFPVRVQGETAKDEIAAAIEAFNAWGKADVLIVGRGGGSLEDLWAFNEEIVARAIFNSQIPIVSAVGHEIDFSISDFVADVRAATPSAAAELVVPDQQELSGALNTYGDRFQHALSRRIQTQREKINHIQQGYGFRRPADFVHQKMQQVDDLEKQMSRSIRHKMDIRQQQLSAAAEKLKALNPTAILKRGYSITYKNGSVVKNTADLQPLDIVQVKLAKGQFISQVQMLGEEQ